MPATLPYPGVYIEEVPSGVRTITGVATSITAFVGSSLRGPVNQPVRIGSFGDFERVFGSLARSSRMSYAVQQFFTNGGSDALIVRVVRTESDDQQENAAPATAQIGGLSLEAGNPGAWGNRLSVTIDADVSDGDDDTLFNVTIEELEAVGSETVVAREVHRNVSTDPTSRRFVQNVLTERLALPINVTAVPDDPPSAGSQAFENGRDGATPTGDEYQSTEGGIRALEQADLFNLLCIPPFSAEQEVPGSTWTSALSYIASRNRRAMLLIDPPSDWSSVDTAVADFANFPVSPNENAAIFFPYIRTADPLDENRLADFPPSGAVAGVIARTDAQRGVWKAPAGIEATLRGIPELALKLSDFDNGRLNPLGVNCLRAFPVMGRVVWGARTLRGADRLASEWKYLPVRRLALFLEESLYRGTQWAVFEPNDEPLWAQLRLAIGSFMQNLFRQGAFQGQTPRQAYFVKCDSETTTQNDINLGIVNVLVGFAPLKPAEFVVIRIQQKVEDPS
jgi:phage tail sheath protein FI